MDNFIQVPPDSTGKRLRTRQDVVGGNAVETQVVTQAALPTFYAWSGAQAFANGKHFLSVFNTVGSGKIVRIKKVYLVNMQTAVITGVLFQMDFRKTSAQSVGTPITPVSMDSQDTVPAQTVVAVAAGATVTNGPLLFSQILSNEEPTAPHTAPTPMIQAGINWIPEGVEVKEITLRPGEGFTVQNVTNTAVGSFAVLFVFTVE